MFRKFLLKIIYSILKYIVEQNRITEAQNECRDKTKFLESIRRYLESLTEDAHPQNCAVNVLPALCDAMRTVESVSRYYARHGYLGLIFSKVTNQLVKICKHYIDDDLTQLWPKLFNEIQCEGVIDDIKENFHLDKRVCLSDYFVKSCSSFFCNFFVHRI